MASPRCGQYALAGIFYGMRRGEMFKLQDEDVAFDLKLIRLRDPKGRKTLSIGMSSLVEELLQEQMAWRDEHFPGSPYVFPGKNGEMRKDCTAVDRFRKAAGLPPFHGLRHHFAVSLANSGKFSMDMISEMLTHKNVDFTKKKNAQFLPETLAAASNAAADILSGQR